MPSSAFAHRFLETPTGRLPEMRTTYGRRPDSAPLIGDEHVIRWEAIWFVGHRLVPMPRRGFRALALALVVVAELRPRRHAGTRGGATGGAAGHVAACVVLAGVGRANRGGRVQVGAIPLREAAQRAV